MTEEKQKNNASDRLLRGLYATDASMYQIIPRAVHAPKNPTEAIKIIRDCALEKSPLLARGGGTGLAGQAIGDAVILDFSRHMNRVLEINPDALWARVEPGVVCAELNAKLLPLGLHFAPDTSTQNRATIGGMIANNSAGMRSVKYGMTIDHILEIDLALANGEVVHLGPASPDATQSHNKKEDPLHRIEQQLHLLLERNKNEILARYPKVIRHSGGYPLNKLLDSSPWNPAKLICGSEGTLGIVLEAKLKLTPLPRLSALCIGHFSSLEAALELAPALVAEGPSAVELVDGVVLEQARKHPLTRDLCNRLLVGAPKAILVIETQADDSVTLESHINSLAAVVSRTAYAAPLALEEETIRSTWQLRSSALGLMTTVQGEKKPVPYIEDAAVPLQNLAAYVKDVLAVCKAHSQPVSMFGHASVGLIHIRPLHDLHDPKEIARMARIQKEVFSLVKQHGGSWSGEHGDGMVRGGYNEEFFGQQLYQAFRDVKEIFDPEGRMNPGKIIDTPPLGSHLRFESSPLRIPAKGLFRYSNGDLAAAAEQCTGIGACRKTLDGVMCPSYMATRDELHSTRGRANALRLALSGLFGTENVLASEELHTAMELCLGCKGCKSECPNSVDMTRLKSETLFAYQQTHGVPLRSKLFGELPRMAPWLVGPHAKLINRLLASMPFRRVLKSWVGIDSDRVLPPFATQRLSHWFRKHRTDSSSKKRAQLPQVALFNDTYMEYFLPQVGRAAIEVLEAAGYQVDLITVGDSQRSSISLGRLDRAKREGELLYQKIDQLLSDQTPLLVCEPSCASALADDLPDLLDDPETGRKIARKVRMFDHFLEQEVDAGRCELPLSKSSQQKAGTVVVHTHCHQKMLDGGQWTHRLLNRLPVEKVMDSGAGCCGMAGTFGYEVEHSALSRNIASQRLLPRLHGVPQDTIVISNGFSCRHQIADLSGRRPLHVTEMIRNFIECSQK